MKISQNKNKIYVKSIDKLENDMLSTVKRYMDSTITNKPETVSSIVTEVVSRVKEELIKDGLIK